MKFLRHLIGITELDKEKNQFIRGKTGAQNIVKEIKQYWRKWLQHVQRMDTNNINYLSDNQNKQALNSLLTSYSLYSVKTFLREFIMILTL